MVEETEKLVEETTEKKDTPKIDSKYRMIILAAQRSKQIQRGANPKIDMDIRKHKQTRIALKELEKGVVHFDILSEKK
jgi:DNA-directed RNA polymerase subunit omega